MASEFCRFSLRIESLVIRSAKKLLGRDTTADRFNLRIESLVIRSSVMRASPSHASKVSISELRVLLFVVNEMKALREQYDVFQSQN